MCIQTMSRWFPEKKKKPKDEDYPIGWSVIGTVVPKKENNQEEK